MARIGAGDRVLEIGCGTGQLTGSLLARGLRVTALEPGDQLIAIAAENLKDAGDVEFVNARLEDMQLPRERYQAVFSASAIHWADPDLSWRTIADVLAPGGTLALIQYFGLRQQRSADDQEQLLSAMRRHAPEIAATWPTYRDLESTIAGVQERRRNVADAWGWLGSYDIGRDYAADLFEDVQLATVPKLIEHTADELNALLGTMSFWARLSPDQRDALASENRALHERLGRPIRASTLAGLVTARRRGPEPRTDRPTVRTPRSWPFWCHRGARRPPQRRPRTNSAHPRMLSDPLRLLGRAAAGTARESAPFPTDLRERRQSSPSSGRARPTRDTRECQVREVRGQPARALLRRGRHQAILRPLRGRTVGNGDDTLTVRGEGEGDARDDAYRDRSTPDGRSLGRFAHELDQYPLRRRPLGKMLPGSDPWGGVGGQRPEAARRAKGGLIVTAWGAGSTATCGGRDRTRLQHSGDARAI